MTLLGYDTLTMWKTQAQGAVRGWDSTLTADLTAGTGQNGLPSFHHTSGSVQTDAMSFAARTNLLVGCAYYWTEAPGVAITLIEFRNASTEQFALFIGTDGSIIAMKVDGSDVELGRTAANIVFPNVHNYIEVKVFQSATVGTVDVWLNGDPTPVLSLTGKNTGSLTYDNFLLSHNPTRGDSDFSMIYWLDPSIGSAPYTTALGNVRGAAHRPSGNGNSSQLVGSDGNSTDNYLLVDESTPDDDTTYVESSTVGNEDTYTMDDLPTAPDTMLAVQSWLWAKKSDAGFRQIAPVIRRSGTDYVGTDVTLGTSYQPHLEIFTADPSTAAAWTEAGVNALELGGKVTA